MQGQVTERVARQEEAAVPDAPQLRPGASRAAAVLNPVQSPRTAVLVPAFDAEPWVAEVVRGCLLETPEVLVVDDGSRDTTARRAAEAGADVVSLARNRGKGAALREGFRLLLERGVDRVVTVDADGQHLPSEIPRLIDAAGQADLVLGTREHLFAEMGRLRRISNRLSSRAISLAAGEPIADVQTGFRLYGRRLLERDLLRESRFEAESAVVVRACRSGFRVASVPVRLGFADGRATSHYRPLLDSLRIAHAVTRARFESTSANGDVPPRSSADGRRA